MNNILILSKMALEYYESGRSKTLVSGYERNVLTNQDHEECLFVNSDYIAQPGDVIFRCSTVNQQSRIELKEERTRELGIGIFALKGKFTSEEWIYMLDKLNGVMRPYDIPGKKILEIEFDNTEIYEKISKLNDLEGEILLREIEGFWSKRQNTDAFIAQFL